MLSLPCYAAILTLSQCFQWTCSQFTGKVGKLPLLNPDPQDCNAKSSSAQRCTSRFSHFRLAVWGLLTFTGLGSGDISFSTPNLLISLKSRSGGVISLYFKVILIGFNTFLGLYNSENIKFGEKRNRGQLVRATCTQKVGGSNPRKKFMLVTEETFDFNLFWS